MGHKNKELLLRSSHTRQIMSSGGYALRSKGVPPPPTTTTHISNSRYSLRSGVDVPITTPKIHKSKPKPRKIWGSIREYMKMADESEGFDVLPVGSKLSGGIGPMKLVEKSILFDVIEATVHAIEVHNVTKNSDLEFDSLVKVNTYQAKVWSQINGHLILQIFRQKPLVYTTPANKHGSRSEEAKSLSIPDIAFESFLNNLRGLPELQMMTSVTLILPDSVDRHL